MGKKRTDGAAGTADTVVRLRLRDRTDTDWSFGCTGWLLVYDPRVVTEGVFEELSGCHNLIDDALGWMTGHAAPDHSGGVLGESGLHPRLYRGEAAKRVARIVQLGWDGALAVLPFEVGSNGVDVRFTPSGLTADEKRVQAAKGRERHGLTTLTHPRLAFVAPRGPRLGATWSWMFQFTPAQKRDMFDPGYQVEFDWPGGHYEARGWQFGETEDGDGEECVGQLVVQLSPRPAAVEVGGP